MPLSNYVEGSTVRLNPVKSADAHLTVAFRLSDKGQSCALEVRRGVAQLRDPAPEGERATAWSVVRTTIAQLFATPGVVAEADRQAVMQFFSYFDPPAREPIVLTAR